MRLTVGFVGRTLTGEGSPLREIPFPVVDVVVDSRAVVPGAIFVALKGERTDGHEYVRHALDAGASAAIVRRGWAARQPADDRLVAVDDPLSALQRLSGAWRRQMPAVVVAVTGSVGKTLTKDVIATVLAARFRVHTSFRNYNNEIGLPLTLLGLCQEHEYAALEMGMYALGEIAQLAALALPAIGVVTNVGPTHLERLGSIEAIAAAKAELIQALPADGTAVLNGDDERVLAMAAMAIRPADGSSPVTLPCDISGVVTYGFGDRCDVRATGWAPMGMAGSEVTVAAWGESRCLTLPLPGRHSIYAALAAVAVALRSGLTWEEVARGLAESAACSRMRCLRTGALTILDDSYNSAPASATAALDLLAQVDGRRVAVLGDMLELGSYAEAGHREVGRRSASAADLVLAVGPRARWLAEEARHAGARQVVEAAGNDEALAALDRLLHPGDTVLVKGSRGMQMEAIVTALAARATLA